MRRCRLESLGVSLPRRGLFRWGSLKHALAAGRTCLEASRYHPMDVRMLVYTGIHRDEHVCEPAFAAYVQNGLGINTEFQGRRTLSFDLQNGGVGMLNGVHLLHSMMNAGEIHAGMVVSAEANADRRPDPEYTYPASGAAVLVDLSPRRQVGFSAFAFDTREEHAGLFTSVVSLKQKFGRLILQRRRAELEEAWLAGARAATDEVLARDGLTREQVDLVVPAQISEGFLKRLPEAIGIPRERIADFTKDLPDTHSTSVFLALQRVLLATPQGRGRKALLLAFGSGVTVGAATYHF